jgi:hypothetical protein
MLASGMPWAEWPKCFCAACCERAFRPQVPDLERLLLREAGRHHLAEHPHQHLVGERPVFRSTTMRST